MQLLPKLNNNIKSQQNTWDNNNLYLMGSFGWVGEHIA